MGEKGVCFFTLSAIRVGLCRYSLFMSLLCKFLLSVSTVLCCQQLGF